MIHPLLISAPLKDGAYAELLGDYLRIAMLPPLAATAARANPGWGCRGHEGTGAAKLSAVCVHSFRSPSHSDGGVIWT